MRECTRQKLSARFVRLTLALGSLSLFAAPGEASTIFSGLSTYNSAVGAHSVITFQGLADGTVVTNQFTGLGQHLRTAPAWRVSF
jgi:hypothetical protein